MAPILEAAPQNEKACSGALTGARFEGVAGGAKRGLDQKQLLKLALCAAVAVLFASAASAATVISVGDGDTLRVRDGGQQVTIRLACIDAPEMAQAPHGARSRELLQRLAQVGSEVSLRILPPTGRKFQHQRLGWIEVLRSS